MAHFENYLKGSGLDVRMEYLGEQQLLALQVYALNVSEDYV